MKKHVCFFMHSFQGGGVERVFINLAQSFLNEGYKVTILVLSKSGEYLNQIDDSFEVVELSRSNIFHFKTIRLIPKLVKYLRKENPATLISALTINNIVSVIAWKISRVNCKLILTEHSSFEWLREVSYFRAKVLKTCIKYLYKYATIIVAVSDGLAKELVVNFSLPAEKIITIYNPTNINDIIIKAKEPVNFSWFDGSKRNIVSVGRLTDQKNFSLLLSAYQKVSKLIPDTFLVIIGEGKLRPDLERQARELGISNSIRMPGFIDNPFSIVSRSDVFVLSSKYEGFGNVLVEAMACGVSVVSTDCPSGPSEIILNGTFGKLVPLDSDELMVEAICDALKNKTDKNILIDRARDFDVNKIFSHYKQIV